MMRNNPGSRFLQLGKKLPCFDDLKADHFIQKLQALTSVKT